MIKTRTLCTLLAVVWLAVISLGPIFYQSGWHDWAQASDLAARWSYTHVWRVALAALLIWHLLPKLGGGDR